MVIQHFDYRRSAIVIRMIAHGVEGLFSHGNVTRSFCSTYRCLWLWLEVGGAWAEGALHGITFSRIG